MTYSFKHVRPFMRNVRASIVIGTLPTTALD